MIRQKKRFERPKSLRKPGKFTEEMKAQLLADQHNLCYICGRRVNIDFEIDHLRSLASRPALRRSWRNLFLCCRYCNQKKKEKFNGILHPLEHNIEDMIYQAIDFENGRGVFRAVANSEDARVKETIDLLELIFNGGGPDFRTTREQRFFNYAREVVSEFKLLCKRWLETESSDLHRQICRSLLIDAEMLGFKYWIVKENARLEAAFGEYMVWNKKGNKKKRIRPE